MRTEGRKVAIVSAHPDDEVVGAGAQIPRMDCTLIHVTDGAPRNRPDAVNAGYACLEDYAHARRKELHSAMALAGLGPERASDLGVPDQEASLSMGHIARRLREMLASLNPDVVMTHPYEGGHPDHDATAFAVHAALALMEREGSPRPELLEMTSYHDRQGSIAVYEFLPADTTVTTVVLSPEERELKRHMMDCFYTQLHVLKAFPIEVERFRPAPWYNFVAPPHPGTLYYEHFDWGMTGGRWRFLAESALRELGLDRVLWDTRS